MYKDLDWWTGLRKEQQSEAYLGPTTRGVFRALRKIYEGTFFMESVNEFKLMAILTKKLFSIINVRQGSKYEPAITCSKITIETTEQGVKYVQSYQ